MKWMGTVKNNETTEVLKAYGAVWWLSRWAELTDAYAELPVF